MLPLKDKDRPVVQKLLAAGCCARCILRFCCVRVQAVYRQPPQETLRELQAFICSTENTEAPDAAAAAAAAAESTEENNSSHDAVGPEAPEEPPSKRVKVELSVCVVCLGILQEFCGPTQAVKIAETVKAEKYEFDSLVLSVSLPPQLCVREFSCWLHVKKEVREKSQVLDKDDVIQVKEAFKWIMQGLVAKELGGVSVVTKSAFEVGVEFTHSATDSDCHFLASTCPDCFKPTKNKQDVQCLHISVFIAGRYNKFCRSLPQTPWVIDGERRMESSVEELIGSPVLSAFRADGECEGQRSSTNRQIKSGSEICRLSPGNSTDSGGHRSKRAMSRMKEGEEEKTKSYSALVWTQKPISREDISFIDDIKELTLDQKTPLRVLHRRALAVRQRNIHNMKTDYIKEFVHGDFGRTKPNLCDLLKTEVDILELDVESVDVDWPPVVPD
ncbi:hypothetical protein INR49_002291 [Caranx melampygus]|nr:hypothetical protein INR49_002291 [Caranx melampygus]